jgi:tetratricopeptide (TPR) repeat protein
LLAGVALAHETSQPAKPDQADTMASVPLYDNLGDLSYPITTHHALAQRYFDQGLRLTYAFNHGEALQAFREAQRHAPECAMCYWGEAFVLGPNINAPMDAAAIKPAVAAIAKAQRFASQATPREQALIQALAKRYADDPKADRAALNQAYANAMAEAANRFPEDQDIAVLYIDALMNVSPWDYWEADATTPKGRIGEALQVAERVLATNPDHPGAIHLYIHLTEASANPDRAEPYADRLVHLMPGAGHLVHMPSHTCFRIGRDHESAETNKAAGQAVVAYLARVLAGGCYAYGG